MTLSKCFGVAKYMIVSTKITLETGAILSSTQRKGQLYISCAKTMDLLEYLFPSVTEKRQYEETGIILKENVNPKCLLSKFYLRRLWWSFMAYTEVTSLDGSPSIWQRIRVAKNRFVKPMIVGNEVKQRVVVNWIGKTIWWITTVGLSGCLITTFYDWKNNGNDEIQNRIERIDRTLIQQTTNDSIEVKEISKRIDSLNMNLRHLIKVQEKKR